MASAIFNPNELILDRVRFVEEYNPSTSEIMGRYTQIEDPTLETSSDPTDVVDAIGSPIHTFYRNQQEYPAVLPGCGGRKGPSGRILSSHPPGCR